MFQSIIQTLKNKVFFQWFQIEKHGIISKKLSALLRGTTSKHQGDFCCLTYLHSFATEKKKCNSHKKLCEHFLQRCNEILDTKKLKFSQYQKSYKALFIIYTDLKYLIEKIKGCENNHENSSTTKVSEHTPSGFSVSTI